MINYTLAYELADIAFGRIKELIESLSSMSKLSFFLAMTAGGEVDVFRAIRQYNYMVASYFPYVAPFYANLPSSEWWKLEGSRLVKMSSEEFAKAVSGVHIISTEPAFQGPLTGTGKTTTLLWLACKPIVDAKYESYRNCVEDVFEAGLYVNNAEDARALVKDVLRIQRPIPWVIFDDFGGYGGKATKDKEFIALIKRLLTFHRALIGVVLIASNSYTTVTRTVLEEATSFGFVMPYTVPSISVAAEGEALKELEESGVVRRGKYVIRVRWVKPIFVGASTLKIAPYINPLLRGGKGSALMTYIPYEEVSESRSAPSYKLSYAARKRNLLPPSPGEEGENEGGNGEEGGGEGGAAP